MKNDNLYIEAKFQEEKRRISENISKKTSMLIEKEKSRYERELINFRKIWENELNLSNLSIIEEDHLNSMCEIAMKEKLNIYKKELEIKEAEEREKIKQKLNDYKFNKKKEMELSINEEIEEIHKIWENEKKIKIINFQKDIENLKISAYNELQRISDQNIDNEIQELQQSQGNEFNFSINLKERQEKLTLLQNSISEKEKIILDEKKYNNELKEKISNLKKESQEKKINSNRNSVIQKIKSQIQEKKQEKLNLCNNENLSDEKENEIINFTSNNPGTSESEDQSSKKYFESSNSREIEFIVSSDYRN